MPSLAFLLGNWVLLQFSTAPHGWVWLLGCCGCLVGAFLLSGVLRTGLLLAAILFAGVFWQLLHVQTILAERIPAPLEGKTLLVTGTVASIPHRSVSAAAPATESAWPTWTTTATWMCYWRATT